MEDNKTDNVLTIKEYGIREISRGATKILRELEKEKGVLITRNDCPVGVLFFIDDKVFSLEKIKQIRGLYE